MKTLRQVRDEFIQEAATEFLAVLATRVETGLKTEAEAQAFRSRLPRAVLLATTPDMMKRVSDTTWDVWSTGKEMDKVYTVGDTCNCPDADPRTGKAPQGYCKHRLARFLAIRADKGLAMLRARLEGPRLPHRHSNECGHEEMDDCWDTSCTTLHESSLCDTCSNTTENQTAIQEEHPMDQRAVHTAPHIKALIEPQGNDKPEHRSTENGCEEGCEACAWEAVTGDPISPPLHAPAQYEERPLFTPRPDPLPEAAASLNLKAGPLMYTMRAHTDQEILDRLPALLAGLKAIFGVNFFPTE